MSTILAFSHLFAGTSPEDRWAAANTRPALSKTMAAIVVASTVAHAGIMTIALVAPTAPGSEPGEVTVDLVQDPPKPDAAAPKPEPAKASPPPKEETKQETKLEPKPAPREPKALPQEAPSTPEKASAAQPDAKTAVPQLQAKASAPRPEKAAASKPDAKASIPRQERKAQSSRPEPPAQAEVTQSRLDEIKRRLVDELLHQQARVETRQTISQGEKHVARPSGTSAKSLEAIALPGSTTGDGEAMGFEELVFSQLAKAKDLSRRRGLPGAAGVRFTIDDHGGLSKVELVRPSGIEALDDEATSIIRRAAPFPVPPKGAERTFAVSVEFVAED